METQTQFQLVYGREVVVPVEFIVPSIFISQATKMISDATLKEGMDQIMELDESRFLAQFQKSVEQRRKKSWHNRHIKKKTFTVGDHALLYDNKFQKFPWKLQMHWLGPFTVVEIKYSEVINLV